MNKEAVEMLEKILKKDISLLTIQDKGFLKARRSYLTDEQIVRYADILGVEIMHGEDTNVDSVFAPIEVKDYDPNEPILPELPPEIIPEEVPVVKFAELLAKGQRLGLNVRIGMKREVVESMIAEAEAKGLSVKPEGSADTEE